MRARWLMPIDGQPLRVETETVEAAAEIIQRDEGRLNALGWRCFVVCADSGGQPGFVDAGFKIEAGRVIADVI